MKIKPKHFVVGALLSTCSLAIVSSITSTFAWYSYNTKNGMAFSGVASGRTESLQVKLSSEEATEWRSDLGKDELIADSYASGFSNGNLSPVTQAKGIGKKGEEAKLDRAANHYGFYGAPTYMIPKSTQNGISYTVDSAKHYTFFRTSIDFRCINPLDEDEFFAKKVYISHMVVKATSDGKDVSKALRLHINQGTSNYLISPGYDADQSLALTGKLRLSPETVAPAYDKAVRTSAEETKGTIDATYRRAYSWETEEDLEEIIYGNVKDAKELSYGLTNTVTTFKDGVVESEKILVCTTNDDGTAATVNLTMWLEGWEPDVKNENISAEFNFGIQFECEILK